MIRLLDCHLKYSIFREKSESEVQEEMDHTPVAGYTRYGAETSLSRLNRHRESILVAVVHQFPKGVHPFLPSHIEVRYLLQHWARAVDPGISSHGG